MSRISEFVNRPLDTTHVSGWRWYLAVVRKWWAWYLFWLAFIGFDIWRMVSH